MAANSATFAYTIVYVKDVGASIDFYQKAFGYTVRRLDHSNRWGELESGHTTIAFTPLHQHETDNLTGQVQIPNDGRHRQPLEVCFDYPDVDAAFKIVCDNDFFFMGSGGDYVGDSGVERAVENGATAVRAPEKKEWGQKVGYVRDLDGVVVRMGSYVQQSKKNT